MSLSQTDFFGNINFALKVCNFGTNSRRIPSDGFGEEERIYGKVHLALESKELILRV
jgi:hypothetical protein